MFGIETKIENRVFRVRKAAEKQVPHVFNRLGADFEDEVRQSIEVSDKPSDVGSPPHTRDRGRKSLRKAFKHAASKDDVLVGPVASVIGKVGSAHERGGMFRGQKYKPRPFMRPALDRFVGRIPRAFAGSIHE